MVRNRKATGILCQPFSLSLIPFLIPVSMQGRKFSAHSISLLSPHSLQRAVGTTISAEHSQRCFGGLCLLLRQRKGLLHPLDLKTPFKTCWRELSRECTRFVSFLTELEFLSLLKWKILNFCSRDCPALGEYCKILTLSQSTAPQAAWTSTLASSFTAWNTTCSTCCTPT